MPPTSTTAMMTAKITPTIQPGTSKETRIASTTELACTAGANTMAQPRMFLFNLYKLLYYIHLDFHDE